MPADVRQRSYGNYDPHVWGKTMSSLFSAKQAPNKHRNLPRRIVDEKPRVLCPYVISLRSCTRSLMVSDITV
jgi:hypothetical protein